MAKETEAEKLERYRKLERFTELFVVIKQGVYMQGVYGPYATPSSARSTAIGLALSDTDSYHDYVVRRLAHGELHDHDYYRFTKETAEELVNAD